MYRYVYMHRYMYKQRYKFMYRHIDLDIDPNVDIDWAAATSWGRVVQRQLGLLQRSLEFLLG